METRGWYNDPTYSDLTIRLGDGSEVGAHKIVLCIANEYFRKLCAPGSHFAVSVTLRSHRVMNSS